MGDSRNNRRLFQILAKQAREWKLRPCIEKFESRILLSNDFENAALSDFDVSAIIAGVNGLSNFGLALSQTGTLVEPLRFFKAPGYGTSARWPHQRCATPPGAVGQPDIRFPCDNTYCESN